MAAGTKVDENHMNDQEIKKRIDLAVSIVCENDAYLLQHDLNERTVAHKFATSYTELRIFLVGHNTSHW